MTVLLMNELKYEDGEGLSNKLISFRDEYLKDDSDRMNYVRWRRWENYSWTGFALSVLMLIGVISESGTNISNDLIIVSIMSVATLFLSAELRTSHKELDMSLQDVHLHDIAYVIDQYDKKDFDKVEDRLGRIQHNRDNYKFLPEIRKEGIDEYADKIEDSDTEYLKNTFVPVINIIVDDFERELDNGIEYYINADKKEDTSHQLSSLSSLPLILSSSQRNE